jgi:hypothetical protein
MKIENLCFTITPTHSIGWDSVVRIATGYGLHDRGVGVRVPVDQEFSLHHVVQASFGAHPVSYHMGTCGSFPGGR